MSDDYNSELEEQRRLMEAYNRAVDEHNRAVELNNRLRIEVGYSQQDTATAAALVAKLKAAISPHMENTAVETEKEHVIAENVSRTIDDLVESYKLLKNGSTASKNLTDNYDKYYTYYGLYNELRQVSLGYTVGLDSNLWQSDEPRKKVEKMYLANTDYWLAYATMAVMLWASDEKEACERAVSKSMQINERKSALFFLLSSLRFNRITAAKEWYKVYFGMVESDGVGDEIIYILQVLLCGALGNDVAFEKQVSDRMRELIVDAKKQVATSKLVQESIDNHISAMISVTRKEYLDFKHICSEYDDLIYMLSEAEKNAMLKEYFLTVINDDFSMSDRLAERIEDSLYSLISSYDDNELALLDKIKYEEAVVKANGKLDVAKESYDKQIAERDNKNNIALIMVDAAFDDKKKNDSRVRKFSFDAFRSDFVDGVKRFGVYRKKEKREYPLSIDGFAMRGDENSFEENKPKLLKYYDGLIKQKIKEDKPVNTSKISSTVSIILFCLFMVLGVFGFISSWGTGICVTLIVLAVVAAGAGALFLYMLHDQKKKIRESFKCRIDNGVKMLEDGLKDLGNWRKDYKAADAVHEELLQVLKEEK